MHACRPPVKCHHLHYNFCAAFLGHVCSLYHGASSPSFVYFFTGATWSNWADYKLEVMSSHCTLISIFRLQW